MLQRLLRRISDLDQHADRDRDVDALAVDRLEAEDREALAERDLLQIGADRKLEGAVAFEDVAFA